MSTRARWALLVALVAPLAIVGWLIASSAPDPAAESARGPQPPVAAAEQLPTPAATAAAEQRRRERQRERQIEREDPALEDDLPEQYDRQIEAETPAASAVVARFYDAFSGYEIGQLDRAGERAISATATPSFAKQLLGEPPRVPAGAAAPARARLGRLEFVPLASERPTARLQRAELVGISIRAGGRETIAFRLEREAGEGWRVAGIGR
jgi:hypothetical protein